MEYGPVSRGFVPSGRGQTRGLGIDTTHVEHRIVTFTDPSGQQCRRWVRMLIDPFGAHDIIWEPGTTEIPDKEGFPRSG